MSIELNFTAFRTNLRRLMEARGYNIKTFSCEVDMTAATLSRYLSGDRKPDLAYVVRLAEYFNVSVDWLLGLSGDVFGAMPPELQEIASLYSVATKDDKSVVQAVLKKYKGQ